MPSASLLPLRQIIRQHIYMPEDQAIDNLLQLNPLTDENRLKVESTALNFVEQCRNNPDKQGLFDAFLREYSLSSQEGVVLMTLAEALLRVPDSHTIDKLIKEKIHLGQWGEHLGNSDELLVNAASRGLVLTSKILNKQVDKTESPENWFRKLINRVGEPLVRSATVQAMKFMGQQYVLGRDIEEAAKRGRKGNPSGTRFSFDMLGEGARTYADAKKYFEAYMLAIHSIGKKNQQTSVGLADGISVKLSALHPRYEFSHHHLVLAELVPSVIELAKAAKQYNIGFTIDAEEAARLDIELDVFEALAFAPQLAGWDGLGFVLQAYQKRAVFVVDWLVQLATLSQHKLMVRLVKGAYWDAEIKHAQEQGLVDFPVFSRKVHTDLSYQVCAGKLLANRVVLYPQFATHNAYTVALIMQMVEGELDSFEFQRLHGMGDLLYSQIMQLNGQALPLRVYAPVGVHRDLLPYLVRRLLENGANGSFVNQFLDGKIAAANLAKSVEATIEGMSGKRNTKIPLAHDLFTAAGEQRANSRGVDLDDPLAVAEIQQEITLIQQHKPSHSWSVGPIINGQMRIDEPQAILSPADKNLLVGYCTDAQPQDIEQAFTSAAQAQIKWQAIGVNKRADILDKVADLLEQQTEQLTALISFEAGRTLGDGVSEVREAVDFCRYYALQARLLNANHADATGLSTAKGIFVCISPWNFPLAIFVGQVVAALVTGNAVLAKPAEQTPIIAALAVKIMHQAGVPVEVLHLITGTGVKVGSILMANPLVAGVAFTGSSETAQRIQVNLIQRGLDHPGVTMPPFIAETGGQNVMIVDSTALPEQVVDTVIQSAFLSAGQRCSSLRVLYLQQDIADNVIAMLKGAIATLKVGLPWELSSDIGPVIDQKALTNLTAHCQRMQQQATLLTMGSLSKECQNGVFIAPQVFEIQNIEQLKREVFGPILHVIRFKATELDLILKDINATGYGLTLGIHSRLKQFADKVFSETKVGNTYINRNMVGAVVGVNPFGGQGLSGTGFKAGGPHYLLRFTDLWASIAIEAKTLGNESLSPLTLASLNTLKTNQSTWNKVKPIKRVSSLAACLEKLQTHDVAGTLASVADICLQRISLVNSEQMQTQDLPGPTGETNELSLHGRGVVLLGFSQMMQTDNWIQLFSALAAGNSIMLIGYDEQAQHSARAIAAQLALVTKGEIPMIVASANSHGELATLLHHPLIDAVASVQVEGLMPHLALRSGAIIPLINHVTAAFALLPYSVEKTRTDNIVATGGNAMLLNLKE
ncbi:bifunctional proline dehydrogenase/L-glutamate gamma-semialdehyde dehydrogenase PutA [Paraglaciecola hydrolytica]|uniref:Bifunctional protein PutA n=1 Tax=Paraglaciecola hydrolytica TaxID=1799789 RepID=A0A148KN07_9ALTE|nr:bifunctional proline dehydrogenase/L-glutamate gamma-semialdehyde dehydrogenase PutA [Paraglaciecola hydrolytica]KXI27677.1 integrase [Paraglaciecola hydrolytica]